MNLTPSGCAGVFGNAAGNHLYALARGIDHRPVVTERVEKSMGAEHTFAADTRCVADIERAVQGIAYGGAAAARSRENRRCADH